MRPRLFSVVFQDLPCLQRRYLSLNNQKNINPEPSVKSIHCYKSLFPWSNTSELAEHLASSVVYNKGGLIALNKPFGIKIHSHSEKDNRSKNGQRYAIPSIPVCDLAIEDALGNLKEHLNVANLTILKSTEQYSSGIVLLGTDEKTAAALKKSVNLAKLQKKPHLIHWAITLGCPTLNYKKQKVGIKFIQDEKEERKQPVIVVNPSNRECKLRKVHTAQVEYRMLSSNRKLNTCLVEIATSSVAHYFVRVYASSHIASILGDLIYSNRMNTLLGVPIKLHIQHSLAYDMPPLPANITQKLYLPKGANCSMMPNMLHLRSFYLPSFKGEDVTITAGLPPHFKWTAEQLDLFSSCTDQ